MRYPLAMSAVCLLVLSGCGDSYENPLDAPRREVSPGAFGVTADSLETPAAKPTRSDQKKERASEAAVGGQAVADQETPEPPVEEADREEAKVGVGEKGSGYGGNMITTPVSIYWRAQERITFDQVKHATDLYKATTGRAPQTHEEFMEKIIKANMLKLPQLRSGDRYVYDPKKEELMVEHSGR